MYRNAVDAGADPLESVKLDITVQLRVEYAPGQALMVKLSRACSIDSESGFAEGPGNSPSKWARIRFRLVHQKLIVSQFDDGYNLSPTVRLGCEGLLSLGDHSTITGKDRR